MEEHKDGCRERQHMHAESGSSSERSCCSGAAAAVNAVASAVLLQQLRVSYWCMYVAAALPYELPQLLLLHANLYSPCSPP
jgi:hypothetical protein